MPGKIDIDYVCRETAGETLAGTVARTERERIVEACKAAMAVIERACERQAAKAKDKDEAIAIDYTCKSAMLLAYGGQ